MSTKSKNLVLNPESQVDNSSKFSNFSLRNNNKCCSNLPSFSSVQSNNKSNNSKIWATFKMSGHTVADNNKEKTWNKSSKNLSFKTLKNPSFENEIQKCWTKMNEKDISNPSKSSSSTLSLHISAYENSIDAASDDLENLTNKSSKFVTSHLQDIQDLIEFPRQMENNKFNAPQIQQFKASQKLFSPYQDRHTSAYMNSVSSPASLEFLVKDFENRKLAFEQWKVQHIAAQGSEAYNTYVTQFRDYEAQMNKIIEEQRGAPPVQIGENLDAQLHALLSKCKKEDFILAFLHASAKDATLLGTVKAALDSISAPKNVPTLINSYGVRPNMHASLSSSSLHTQGSPSITPSSSAINLRPKVQMTNYGLIPEGWVVDNPIIRPEKLPPPPKSYAEASKLPFFDIGGGK